MEYTLKKSLGQHFLHNETVCQQIVSFVNLDTTHNLAEVGPGAGAITKYLLALPNIHYKAIEIDEEKVAYLNHTFPAIAGKIISQDFLSIEKPFAENFSIIGNFPYNISTQIVFKILDWREDVNDMVGMFQKEVAQRIASVHGNKHYGILSVLVQCFYNVEYLLEVDENSFTPPPKVKSAVIRFTQNHNPYDIKDYKKLKMFVKTAFNQRRKTLRNGLKSITPPEILQQEIFSKRAEQLSVKEFAMLYKSIFEKE